jgi:hypothetical protein
MPACTQLHFALKTPFYHVSHAGSLAVVPE